jgi:hypothetical protein
MYAAGGVLVSKKLPPAPTSFEEGLEMARDAFRYSGTVDNYIRTKVKPVINGTLMLASGNREFDSAAEEVLANNDDSDVQAMVEKDSSSPTRSDPSASTPSSPRLGSRLMTRTTWSPNSTHWRSTRRWLTPSPPLD